MPRTTACSLILIHGIGNQRSTWSQGFRRRLRKELGFDARRVGIVDAYWAPLSTIRETVSPTFASRRMGVRNLGLEEETYNRTVDEFSRMLAAEAGARADVRAFGPVDIWNAIKRRLATAEDTVADVANYVARNGVRTAVQNILHDKLGQVHASTSAAPVIVASHSQGTVISYDVLRQAGTNYPLLRTWITMGSPLRKYFAFPLQWGRQALGMPAQLRWLNLYDKKDIVGKDLRGAVDWTSPRPVDRVVDNVRNASDAHDHWGNQQVTKAVAGEIRRLLR